MISTILKIISSLRLAKGIGSTVLNSTKVKEAIEGKAKHYILIILVLFFSLYMLLQGILFLILTLFFSITNLDNLVYPSLIFGLGSLVLGVIGVLFSLKKNKTKKN